ncbi:MAG: molybdopterin-guanine dinucleotide biosynthesis protein B [Candidatus Bathyarchaeia archaeon]
MRVPVVAVLGRKDSGKTLVIENLVRGLKEQGFRVATAKHVNLEGFSLDEEGRDTWRHAVAGANPVVCVSDVEMAVLIRDGMKKFSLDSLFRFVAGVDIVFLEGFSKLVLENEEVGKVFCVRDQEEYEGYRQGVKGETLAFCSRQPLKEPILRIMEDWETVFKRVVSFIEKERRVSEILDALAGLDCRKCGYKTCRELAVAIHMKKAKLSDCLPLKLKPRLETRIIINGVEVLIQPFVSRIVRNSILGMVSSLKGVSLKGDEKVCVEISR